MKRRIRHQPRIKGGRQSLASRVTSAVWDAVDADAKRHGVGRSWVEAVILGRHYGIDVVNYTEPQRRKKKA